jgi:hypothetical protein
MKPPISFFMEPLKNTFCLYRNVTREMVPVVAVALIVAVIACVYD